MSPEWSPYNMCFDNPIKYVDPDGRAAYSPIYGSMGQFLGTDSQGFKGEAIFMNESTFKLLGGQGMDHNTALQAGSTLSQVIGNDSSPSFTKGEINMVNNAINHMVSKTDGFETSFIQGIGTPYNRDLHNGKISSSFYIQGLLDGTPAVWFSSNVSDNLGGAQPAVALTNSNADKGKALITYNLQQFSYFGLTVENVQNTFFHEYGEHFKNKVPGGHTEEHAKALFNQSLHPSWKDTTLRYKENIRNVYRGYTTRELGR